jgi:hypothetical protein
MIVKSNGASERRTAGAGIWGIAAGGHARAPQIASDGAILVRPDRFIAWRHPAADSGSRAALATVLSQILARPVGTPTGSAA